MIILTVGISGSGKSTYAKELCRTQVNYREVNRDDIRSEYAPLLHQGDCSSYYEAPNLYDMEVEVNKILWSRLKGYIADGLNVVVSDTNLDRWVRKQFEEYAYENNIPLDYRRFSVDLNIAMERNQKRLRKVPKSVILDQYNKWINFIKFN